MQDFIIQSIVASIVLTIIINLIPRFFPKSTIKAEHQLHEKMKQAFAEDDDGKKPKMTVFFPWKSMLVISVFLTLLVNVISIFFQ